MGTNQEEPKIRIALESEIEKQAGQVAGKILGTTADGVMDLASDIVGGLFGDRIREWRTRNLASSLAKTADHLRKLGVPLSQAKALPMGDAYSMFEHASKQDDPTIQDMWGALLANAMNPNSDVRIEPAVANTLRSIGGDEAKLLMFFRDYGSACSSATKRLYQASNGRFEKERYAVEYEAVTKFMTDTRSRLALAYLPDGKTAPRSGSIEILVKEVCICMPAPDFSGFTPMLQLEERSYEPLGRSDAAVKDALNELAQTINLHSGYYDASIPLLNEAGPINALNYELTAYGRHLLQVCQVESNS